MLGASVDELKEIAFHHRKTLVDVAYRTGGAYLAQALSGIDMMTAVFYRYLRNRPDEWLWPERDRFLLSPGHYALALYVILADQGYFERELLYTFKDDGSPLELASHRGTVPGVEVSGGSLGQVLSVGVGMALHAKLRRKKHRIFVMMSDGEQDEGSIWEAAASASHFALDNIVALVDKNGFQVDGPTKLVMNMDPLSDKYRAFGWEVCEVDGNRMEEVVHSLDTLTGTREARPGILIGNTVRGKGIPFMEGNPAYHYTRLSENDIRAAEKILKGEWDAV